MLRKPARHSNTRERRRPAGKTARIPFGNPSYPLAGISRSRTSELTASISSMSDARMASNRRAAKGARKSTMVVRTLAHSFRNSRK
jgi:hypothetical protein